MDKTLAEDESAMSLLLYKFFRRFSFVRRTLAKCCLKQYLAWEGEALTAHGHGHYVLPAGVDVTEVKRFLGISPMAVEARDKAGNIMRLAMERAIVSMREDKR